MDCRVHTSNLTLSLYLLSKCVCVCAGRLVLIWSNLPVDYAQAIRSWRKTGSDTTARTFTHRQITTHVTRPTLMQLNSKPHVHKYGLTCYYTHTTLAWSPGGLRSIPLPEKHVWEFCFEPRILAEVKSLIDLVITSGNKIQRWAD